MKKNVFVATLALVAAFMLSSCNFYFGKIAVYGDADGAYKLTFTESGDYYLDPAGFLTAVYSEAGTYEGDPTAKEGTLTFHCTSTYGSQLENPPAAEVVTVADGKFTKSVFMASSEFSRIE